MDMFFFSFLFRTLLPFLLLGDDHHFHLFFCFRNPQEGGWMDRELGMLSDFGFQGVSLGPRALRTDVACSALIVLAHDRLAADE